MTPCVTFAQNFVPLSDDLENLIGQSPGGGWVPGGGMSSLVNNFFGISVAVAAMLAVIMVAIGGFKYMTSESIFKTSGAKEQITNALVGLIIVLAAVVILSTINPDIVNLRLFETN